MNHRFQLSDPEFEQCKKFAEESSSSQREYRSGGTLKRKLDQIKADTLRGKAGEVIAKKFLEQNPLEIKGISLDFNVYPRGEWDSGDIEINGKKIAIKSSKSFAKFLLIETKDLQMGDASDYYILVLIDDDCRGGRVVGFVSKEEMLTINSETLDLKKDQFIPGTRTPLDADNHCRRMENLHHQESDWIALKQKINF